MPLVKGKFIWETDEAQVFQVTAAYSDLSVVPRTTIPQGWRLASATQLHEMSRSYSSLKVALYACAPPAPSRSYNVFINKNNWDEVTASDKSWIVDRYYVFVGS
jgi:hypothetical protein